MNASTTVWLVSKVYNITNLFLNPIKGLVTESVVAGYTIDNLALLGVFLYLFIAFVIVEIVSSF
jgi:hypothetical protein